MAVETHRPNRRRHAAVGRISAADKVHALREGCADELPNLLMKTLIRERVNTVGITPELEAWIRRFVERLRQDFREIITMVLGSD
jgi:hypothetical protein